MPTRDFSSIKKGETEKGENNKRKNAKWTLRIRRLISTNGENENWAS